MSDQVDGPVRAELDFAWCPECGQRLQVAAEENLYGQLPIDIAIGETGELISADWTTTHVWWDSSVTTHYYCRACTVELPEEHQRVLDVVLRNQREVIEMRPAHKKESQAEIVEAINRHQDAVETYRQAQRMRDY